MVKNTPVLLSSRSVLWMVRVATLSTIGVLNVFFLAVVCQVSESGIGSALFTFAVNVNEFAALIIMEVLPFTVSVIDEASTKKFIFAVSDSRPALSLTMSLNMWLPSSSPVSFLLQLLMPK